MAVWLKENLEGYYVIGCGRDEKLGDEQVSVAYRRDTVNLISMDTFWLSGSPMCREAVTIARASAQGSVPELCFHISGIREKNICSGCITFIWTILAGSQKAGAGAYIEKSGPGTGISGDSCDPGRGF